MECKIISTSKACGKIHDGFILMACNFIIGNRLLLCENHFVSLLLLFHVPFYRGRVPFFCFILFRNMTIWRVLALSMADCRTTTLSYGICGPPQDSLVSELGFMFLNHSRLLKEIGPTAARFPLKIQPLSFQWVVFSSTRPNPATLQKNVAETNALKL
jgi:hypothetical protein